MDLGHQVIHVEGNTMQKESLAALARHHLEQAQAAPSGRSAHTVYGGHEHVLRQTLIALRAGQSGRARESWRGDSSGVTRQGDSRGGRGPMEWLPI